MTARDREGLELSTGDVVRVAYGGDLHEAEISAVCEPHMDTGRWDVELALRVRMPAGACTWVRGPSSRIADRPAAEDSGARAPEVEEPAASMAADSPSGSHEEKTDGHEGSEGHRRTRKTGRKGSE